MLCPQNTHSQQNISVQFSVSAELSMKRLIAKPSRLRIAKDNLDIFLASADAADVADHFRATLFYNSVSKIAGVGSFVTAMTWDSTHQNVLHNSMKPESGHEAGMKHGTDNSWFPVHSCVKVNSLIIIK